ncbi:MAG: sigma-70 family RNA polymerase sigma factor [Proteobacteria bacterium]|nr:sigma-70 family RNA polymerase sigma factor [Pseudomonadota bacterium]
MHPETERRGTRDAARAALAGQLVLTGKGDRAAFRAVYQATSAKLFGLILRICNDRETAEDVLQEVYVTVWNKAEAFDPARASPITWLAAIARNRAIDRIRARKPAAQPLEAAAEVADAAPLADGALEQSDEKRRLEGCLDGLEPRHAAVIRIAFFEGRTYESLAEREGVPVGTMKSWIRRSLIRLRTCLEG